MHVQRLVQLLKRPILVSVEDEADLASLIEQYPYFYLARALLAKVRYRKDKTIDQHVIQSAATYAIDRSYLHSWLADALPMLEIVEEVAAVKQHALAMNDYLEVIAKKSIRKSTNEVSMKQFSAIEAILNESNLQFDPFIEEYTIAQGAIVDLSEQGRETSGGRVITETLAEIMVQQRKYKRAIAIYEQLILKYPPKKSYFNSIIAKLNHYL